MKFNGEEGVDAGGLTREWINNVSSEVVDPKYGLFVSNSTGETYQPNEHSFINPYHLNYFKFYGQLVGKALSSQTTVNAYFTRSFYKHILGMPLTYHDFENIDQAWYKSLKWILGNDLNGFEDLKFVYDEKEAYSEKMKQVELVENGRNITVTNANKK